MSDGYHMVIPVSPTKMLNNTGSNTDPWGAPLIWSPHGRWAMDRNSLNANIQPILYPSRGPSVKSASLSLTGKDVVQDSIKGFAQVQATISCCSLIHQCCSPIIEGHQVCQAWFAPGEARLAVTNHLFSMCLSIISRSICSTVLPGMLVRLTGR